MSDFTPKLVCFSCNFGWGYLTDRQELATAVKNWIPVICSGKVDAPHIMEAFRSGADGVLLVGCADGECHFQDGNYQTKKRINLLKKVLAAHGIEPERLRTAFSLDPEGSSLPLLVEDFGRSIRGLGPVRI